MITWSRCSSALPGTSRTGAEEGCEPAAEDRGGDSEAWSDSLFPIHGDVSLRSGTRILREKRGSVRQSGGFLYLQRRARGFRAADGTAVRRDVAGAGISGGN